MTNFEKYKKELLDITEDDTNVALVKGKPVGCRGTSCTDCDWGKVRCSIEFIKWLYSEYEEPPVDWSKVEVDTPILVSNDGKIWRQRHFTKFEDGKVCSWCGGATSWSGGVVCSWKYAKLPAEEQK